MKSKHQAPGETPSTKKKTWLVEYAVTDVSFGDERTLTNFGLLQGIDLRDAEMAALREHAAAWFAESPSGAPENNEYGKWGTYSGLRAFKLSEQHSDLDAGNIYWVKSLREVDSQDVSILAKYIDRRLTYEQIEAEEKEQIRLRGAGVKATHKSQTK